MVTHFAEVSGNVHAISKPLCHAVIVIQDS